MTILHDLKDHNALMPIGDLIEWYKTPEGKKFMEKGKTDPVYKLMAWRDVITEANQALRQPLEISDFVRPSKPLRIDYEIEPYGADRYEDEVFNDDLDQWIDWKPLFEGFEVTETSRISCKDKHMHIFLGDDLWRVVVSPGLIMEKSNPTREDFLKACKDHNVEL